MDEQQVDEQQALFGMEGRIGGDLCLDFVNTVDWRGRANPGERLREYGDLIRWAEYGGLLTAAEAARMRDVAAQDDGPAEQTLREARALREALFGVLLAVVRQEAPPAADLAVVNRWIGAALAHGALLPTEEGLVWGWQGAQSRLDAPLWPVVRAAVELLQGAQAARIRQCADSECSWLFLDTSKNRSRRWCSMEGCGSRAKAREYYQRKRAARPAASEAPT